MLKWEARSLRVEALGLPTTLASALTATNAHLEVPLLETQWTSSSRLLALERQYHWALPRLAFGQPP